MAAVKIAEDVFWVGAIDWNIRDFHGYSTECGTTYNAYLILDEKITLIDTVKASLFDEFWANLSEIVDPKKIDIVISNHTEMDHSGGLPRLMEKIGKDKPIYCSQMGKKNLSLHFGDSYNLVAVKEGDVLEIGKRKLTFLETRMLHWPDSMFTYMVDEKILFSSDAFGQHYASMGRFDEEVRWDELLYETKKYFANILLLYAPLVVKLLSKVQKMGLEFQMICPDHGIIWKSSISKILELYGKWGRQEKEKKAVVVYDTMWHSTELMAHSIAEGISAKGIEVLPMRLKVCHRSDVVTEILDCAGVVVGSPTLNNGLFPRVAEFLTYLKGLKPKNKLGAAFGSYGWSGEAPALIEREILDMKMEMVTPPLKVQYVPDKDALSRCKELGTEMGARILG